ncbi:hypothetical protein BOX15_Mlig021288g1 [Macrostomum lignano]|uniref:Hemolymph juvenile hormone binding protein n=2 Tax=Macrostomum lignano TaxID=282301 RepID=A0A1I8I9N4_9PLAT|nr:hypothetical protein BOX15_Mlig021288g1 [Macrostomum lignano]
MKLLSILALLALATAALGARLPETSAVARTFSDDENESLNQYIKALLENLKEEMPNGIPDLNIPPLEPLHLPEIYADIEEGMAKVRLHMLDLLIEGLSGFVVREVKGDLNTMSFSLDLFLPEITGQSYYDMDGKVLIFPLYGRGMAGLKVNDLHFKGTARIVIKDMESIQLDHFNIHVEFSQIQIYLENIVGGGNLGNVVNTLLNMLGKLLYDKFRDQILPPLNNIIKNALNEQLAKIKLSDLIGGIGRAPRSRFSVSPVQDSVNTYVDMLMENLRPFMRDNGMDPLSLPNLSTSFSKKIWFVTWRGGASISQGQLRSLSSIHRTGNFGLDQSGNRLTIDGSVGVNQLWGSFRALAWFMSIRISAGIQLTVQRIRVRARLHADVSDLKAVLDLFKISEISNIGVKVSGLGPLNWILGPIATLVVNGVRGKIAQAIESPVKAKVNELLQNLQMPNFSQMH